MTGQMWGGPDLRIQSGSRKQRVLFVVALICVLTVLWIPLAFAVTPIQFTVLSPAAHIGLEAASSLSRLFGALVLLLLPKTFYGRSVRWIACGLVVLALGSVFFGSLPYAVNYELDPNEAILGSVVASSIAGVLFTIGLAFETPPKLSWLVVIASTCAVLLIKLITFLTSDALPVLRTASVDVPSSAAFAELFSDTTLWYWLLMPVPIGISLIVIASGAVRYSQGGLPGWLLIAFTFWAGSQFHNLWWPSIYSLAVTTTDILRFTFALCIVVAGIFALRDATRAYAELLETERLVNEQLARVSKLKDDFTSLVGHELGSPVAAIRRYAELIELDETSDAQRHAVRAIRVETEALRHLVRDIQTVASIEADEFSVDARPVQVGELIEQARLYAVTVEGEHPFIVNCEFRGQVMADAVRIGQVLRNLIDNAAKYSPSGGRVYMNVARNNSHILFQVRDEGLGIEPAAMQRIFQKNERGGHRQHDLYRSGTGLGLYLSQRIVQAHGSEIRVSSPPGEGSTFQFYLEETA